MAKPISEAIRSRLVQYLSVTEKGPFETQARFKLVAAIEEDWKVLKGLGTYGFIQGATGYIIGAINNTQKNLEDYGYLMELIILFATDLGLGSCWLGGTFTKSSFSEKISPRPGEIVPAVAAVGYCAEKPRWFESLVRHGASAESRLPWSKLFFNSGFGVPLSRADADDFAIPLEMVRLGPSASNKQPWRVVKQGEYWHFFLQRTPGYREGMLTRHFTVADLQRIDMGIALCHFELAAREIGLGGYWQLDTVNFELPPDEQIEYTASWVS